MKIDEAIATLRTLCASAPTNDWATRVHIHAAMTTVETELAARGVEIQAATLPEVGPNGQIIRPGPMAPAGPGPNGRQAEAPAGRG